MKPPFIPYEYRHELKDTPIGASYHFNLRWNILMRDIGVHKFVERIFKLIDKLKK